MLSRRAHLVKLRAERLPVGADGGIVEVAILQVIFRAYLTGFVTHDNIGSTEMPEGLDYWNFTD
jgi:hypothetical protein